MPLQIPIRLVAGALDVGQTKTIQEIYEEMMSKTLGFWDGGTGFQNGGTMPTSNIGPWLEGGTQWKFWNTVTGTYDLTTFPTGMVTMFGGMFDVPSGWLLCDGRQFGTGDYEPLFQAIRYTYITDADKTGGNPTDPTKFRIPNFSGRSPIGEGTEGVSRALGGKYGSASVTLAANQIPPLTIGLQARARIPESATPSATDFIPQVGETKRTNVASYDNADQQPVDVTHPSLGIKFIIKY
jgi:microcystin-dependent protein